MLACVTFSVGIKILLSDFGFRKEHSLQNGDWSTYSNRKVNPKAAYLRNKRHAVQKQRLNNSQVSHSQREILIVSAETNSASTHGQALRAQQQNDCSEQHSEKLEILWRWLFSFIPTPLRHISWERPEFMTDSAVKVMFMEAKGSGNLSNCSELHRECEIFFSVKRRLCCWLYWAIKPFECSILWWVHTCTSNALQQMRCWKVRSSWKITFTNSRHWHVMNVSIMGKFIL